ncbi:MAG: DUF2520 domain-containing protein [Eubacteriales bacterium]|nr:DUF2520 domain-containing protein [Eubacteriales bacterium]
MKVGFIGAGKAGCSLGKYFETASQEVCVTGYYSLIEEEAIWAAQFTNSHFFQNMDDVIAASDSIIVSTPDGVIKSVWDTLDKSKISGKMICHLSGSLSSDVFSSCGDYGAYPISIHPMFAFSNKESVFEQLKNVSFTLEGHTYAIEKWQELFAMLGNDTVVIVKEAKSKYHAAASVLSNHVVAVLSMGYELLKECGFSEEEARAFSQVLVRENVEHVIKDGAIQALTGPIERGDEETVTKHLGVLKDSQKDMYRACGNQLLSLSKVKNPERDYEKIERALKGEKNQ